MTVSDGANETKWRPEGFVVLGDESGRILDVVLDVMGLSVPLEERRLTELTTEDSRAKATAFLETVWREGAAFGWELNACLGQEIALLHLWGIKLEDDLLVLASETLLGLHWLYAKVLLLDKAERTGLRGRLQAKGAYPGLHNGAAQDAFEELTRTNNELTNLQRQVAKANVELQQTNRELQEALERVRTLRGLLPICANCKKVRDDEGYWNEVEVYVRDHSEVEFSHSICPDCMRQLYPDFAEEDSLAEDESPLDAPAR
jgi:hypothetical protein